VWLSLIAAGWLDFADRDDAAADAPHSMGSAIPGSAVLFGVDGEPG